MVLSGQVAVVGGAGEVGKLLVRHLAQATGCEKIRVIDARQPAVGTMQAGIRGQIEFVKHTLGTDSIDSLVASLKCIKCVFCVLTPALQGATTDEFLRTNVLGVKSLLAACEEAHVRTFVFLSSIAVTCHELSSSNGKEDDPLPEIASYTSGYELTKRLGEEAVLAADRDGGLRTCALRAAGLLTSPRGHIFATVCCIPGFVYAPACTQPIDVMDGFDICRAMLHAAQALEENPAGIAGEVFLTTKGETIVVGDEMCNMMAEALGWQMVVVPMFVQEIVRFACLMTYRLKEFFGLRTPAVPLHRFLTYGRYEKTFDNSKVQRMLGFRPESSVKNAICRIASEYIEEYGDARTQYLSWLSTMGLGMVGLILFGGSCAHLRRHLSWIDVAK